MIRNAERWKKFEDDLRREWLATLTQSQAFQLMEDAYQEALSLRPDLREKLRENIDLKTDVHIQLLMSTRRFFSQLSFPTK